MSTTIKILFQHFQISSILILLIFTSSCNGQNKTDAARLDPLLKEDKNKTTPYGPGDIIQCGLQDKAGNLWFGTSGGEGVFRFDGESLKSGTISVINFTTKDGLSNNNVSSILEDKSGNIWFNTDNGISRYDPSAGRAGGQGFTNFSISGYELKYIPNGHQDTNLVTFSNSVSSILQDKTGNHWIGTLNQDIYRCDEKYLSGLASAKTGLAAGTSGKVPLTSFLSTELYSV